MPGTGGKLYAEMVLDVDQAIKSLSQFKREIASIPAEGKRAADSLSKNFSHSASEMQNAFRAVGQVIMGLAVAGSILKLSDDAAEAETSILLMKRAFGDLAEETDRWAKVEAKAMGTSVQSMRKGLSAIQILIKGQRGASQASADASKSLTALGINIAAVFGRRTAEGIEAIQGALTGNVVALHKFDIIMTQHLVQQFAETHGLRQQVHELDAYGQSLTKQAFLLHEGVFAMNAAIEMQKTFKGQTNLLRARLTDLSVALGDGVNVALGGMLKIINPILGVIGRLNPVILGTAGALGLFATAAIGVAAAWGPLGVAIAALVSPLKKAFAALVIAVTSANLSLATFQGYLVTIYTRILPITIAVLALVTAYGMLYNAVDKMTRHGPAIDDSTDGIMDKIKKGFLRGLDELKKLILVPEIEVKDPADALAEQKAELERVIKALQKYLESLRSAVDPMDALIDKMEDLVAISNLLMLGDKLAIKKIRGSDNIDNAKAKVLELTAALVKFHSTLGKDTDAASRKQLNNMMTKLNAAQSALSELMNADRSPQQEAAENFIRSLTTGPMAVNMIKALSTVVGDGLRGTVNAIGKLFKKDDVSDKIVGYIGDMLSGAGTMISDMLDEMSPGLSGKIGGFFSGMLAAFGPVGGIVELFSAIITMAPAWEHFQQSMEAVMTALASIFDPILQILASWLQILGPLVASIASLAMAFQPLLDLIGGPVFYVLKGLALAFGVVSIAVLKAARWFRSWFGDTDSLDKSIAEAEKRQTEVWNMTYESAKRASDAMDKMTGATRNVPTWYKVANARLRSVAEETTQTFQNFQKATGPIPMPPTGPVAYMMGKEGMDRRILENFANGVSNEGLANMFKSAQEGRTYIDQVIIQAATNDPQKFAEAFERFRRDFEKRGKPYATPA